MTYKATLVEDKRYEIETEFNGEPVKFHAVVANDESELAGLVEHYLYTFTNPIVPEPQTPAPDLTSVIQEQQAIITSLTERITALENK